MKRPAFTLLEAIIALSILAIVVVYLLPAIYINHNKRNDKSNDIKNAYYAQAIMENYKSKHFTGIDTKLNIPEDLEYQVEEEVSGRFTIVRNSALSLISSMVPTLRMAMEKIIAIIAIVEINSRYVNALFIISTSSALK